MKFSVYVKDESRTVLIEPDDPWVKVGPEVGSLVEARIVVKFLGWLESVNGLPTSLSFYNENTEVQARRGEESWGYMDQDPSGVSDGIWDGPSDE